MKKTVRIKVEWIEEDQAYLATSDDLVGLIIQEQSLESCCRTAQDHARDMLAGYAEDAAVPVMIDFEILDRADERLYIS